VPEAGRRRHHRYLFCAYGCGMSGARMEIILSSLMLIDVGVPRNVATTVAELYNVHLWDIDGLTE